ncbi:MAG: hypothetical protein WAK95_14980, partial [Desulfobacterales bacterium]
RIGQIKTVVATSIAGALPQLEKELAADVNRFFDFPSGACAGPIVGFIRDYRIEAGRHDSSLAENGFLDTLYLIYQEFKLALDTVMTTAVYPDIVRFTRQEEEKIDRHFTAVFRPYEGIVDQGLSELKDVLVGLDIAGRADGTAGARDVPAAAAARESAGLKLPPLVAFLTYSASIKSEAFLSLGVFSLVKFFNTILKRRESGHGGSHARALQKGVRRMKRLTEESLRFQFTDYRENLKFTYLFPLVEEVERRLVENLTERFQAYSNDTGELSAHFDRQQSDREEIAGLIQEMQRAAGEIDDRISRLRRAVENEQ